MLPVRPPLLTPACLMRGRWKIIIRKRSSVENGQAGSGWSSCRGAPLCWAPERMGNTSHHCWQSRTGNWCCHLHGLSKIRQRKTGKRLPGRMSLNVQAEGSGFASSINPSCFPSAHQAAAVCFLAHFRPLPDSWAPFNSVRLKLLSRPFVHCTEMTPLLGHQISFTFRTRQNGRRAWTCSWRICSVGVTLSCQDERPDLWGRFSAPRWICATENSGVWR